MGRARRPALIAIVTDSTSTPAVHLRRQRHRLLNTIVERVPCNFGYKHLGRFKNVRHKYHWQGYVVEIDRTTVRNGIVGIITWGSNDGQAN
jgi:hypothetical protein